METASRERSPPQCASGSRSKVHSLTSKEKFPVQVDFYELLLSVCEKELIALQIPETLLRRPNTHEPVFLYTDKDGYVRALPGTPAQTGFLSVCRSKLKQRKMASPQGHHFPKFVSFGRNAVRCTMNKFAEVRGYLLGRWERIQRFIVSKGLLPQKKTVQWRASKPSKVFTVTSRLARQLQKTLEHSASIPVSTNAASLCPQSYDACGDFLDLRFVASLKDASDCEVTRETRRCDAAEAMAPAIRHILAALHSASEDQIEKFVFSLVEGQDGRWYCLNAGRVKLVESAGNVRKPPHRKTQSVSELPILALNKEQRLFGVRLPRLTTRESLADSSTTGESYSKLSSCPQSPLTADRSIAHFIGNIANKMDELRGQAHALRQVNSCKQIVKFRHRAAGFLERVIPCLYDAVMKDPILTRYFKHKGQIRSQVESAVRHVIVNGICKSRMRSVHSHLYITDAAFDRYVDCFLSCLRAEAVPTEEVSAAQDFCEGLRDDVVTARWEEEL